MDIILLDAERLASRPLCYIPGCKNESAKGRKVCPQCLATILHPINTDTGTEFLFV